MKPSLVLESFMKEISMALVAVRVVCCHGSLRLEGEGRVVGSKAWACLIQTYCQTGLHRSHTISAPVRSKQPRGRPLVLMLMPNVVYWTALWMCTLSIPHNLYLFVLFHTCLSSLPLEFFEFTPYWGNM